MPGAIGWAAQVLSPRGGLRVAQQIQMLGIYLAGFLCLVLAVLKLMIKGHWSWWRVLLPLWVDLGHNALYIAVGFVWLFFADEGAAGEEVTIRQDHRPYVYQLAAMLCSLIFADNLLGLIEGHEETVWFLLSLSRWELIFVSGVLSVVCQLLFWSEVVRTGSRGSRGE
jgi:hypothetical protein